MLKVVINGVSCPVDVYRSKLRSDVAYHVVAGHTLLGQVVKNTTCSWEAQSFKDAIVTPCTSEHRRRHLAVDHLIKLWESQ